VDDVWEWGDTCADIYSVKEAYNNIVFGESRGPILCIIKCEK